jgi:hypothetical protein
MVACFFFQHSPIFGHAASSQTVCNDSPRISFSVSAYSLDVGAFTRIHDGLPARFVPFWGSAPWLAGAAVADVVADKA